MNTPLSHSELLAVLDEEIGKEAKLSSRGSGPAFVAWTALKALREIAMRHEPDPYDIADGDSDPGCRCGDLHRECLDFANVLAAVEAIRHG